MTNTATLSIDGNTLELPIVKGTENERGLDVAKLRASTGCITLDPAYGNTGSCQSAITYIDGDAGILRYRGIPIEQFEKSPNFVEVCWLLIFGELPNQTEYDRFSALLTKHAMLNESMKHHFEGFPSQAPPMAVLSAMINTLYCFHPEINETASENEFEIVAARLLSKIRTIAAFAFRNSTGRPYNYPDPNLHADHEQNCSTSTVRMVGSSGANVFASCAAGVGALWGPLHGGANVAVLEMLEQIHEGSLSVEEYMEKAKDKSSGIKLMGFGHRVYKNFDPRAKILQNIADRLLTYLGIDDPLLEVARQLEQIALDDPYFIERKLYPNVDFYSGIILRAIGIPTGMFTVIFAIGRMPGWIAHWREQQQEGGRISRPRQIYTGSPMRDYVPITERI